MPQSILKPAKMTEPPLKEVINDPIVKLLMQRDGVKQEMLMPLILNALETNRPGHKTA